jgi:hypothetical protein
VPTFSKKMPVKTVFFAKKWYFSKKKSIHMLPFLRRLEKRKSYHLSSILSVPRRILRIDSGKKLFFPEILKKISETPLKCTFFYPIILETK